MKERRLRNKVTNLLNHYQEDKARGIKQPHFSRGSRIINKVITKKKKS
jgi:hypothetical protein